MFALMYSEIKTHAIEVSVVYLQITTHKFQLHLVNMHMQIGLLQSNDPYIRQEQTIIHPSILGDY